MAVIAMQMPGISKRYLRNEDTCISVKETQMPGDDQVREHLPPNLARSLDDDEKDTQNVSTPFGEQDLTVIS